MDQVPYLPSWPQMLLWVAMVSSVSPSCVKVTPSRFSSSSDSLQASALAAAVIEAVNSHAFTPGPPLPHSMRPSFRRACVPSSAAGYFRRAPIQSASIAEEICDPIHIPRMVNTDSVSKHSCAQQLISSITCFTSPPMSWAASHMERHCDAVIIVSP